MLTRRGTRASEAVLLLRRNVRSHKDNENILEKTVAAEDVITEEEEHVARNDMSREMLKLGMMSTSREMLMIVPTRLQQPLR